MINMNNIEVTTDMNCDATLYEKITIGIGGICTLRLKDGNCIDLVRAGINYHTRTLGGRSYQDSKRVDTRHADYHDFKLEDIKEVIFEGFIITAANRDNILNLLHEKDGIKFTKIPQRTEEELEYNF